MKFGYVRVSTLDQNEARQLDGVQVDRTFTDKASGKDTNRPQLEAVMAFLREGDVLVVHSLDRLARNLTDLRRLVETLNQRGVAVQFIKENLTFTGKEDAMAKLMLNIMGAFAEFERCLIKERQREGIAIAKKKGVYKGRAFKLSETQAADLRTRIASGESKAALARAFNISRETLYNYLRA